ncbi:Protein of unknown function [Bacillus wiedmannii]|nr:Protein of unknown function [Bacillus wiedmannii]
MSSAFMRTNMRFRDNLDESIE